MADRLDRPSAYEAHYPTRSEYLNCEFWMANQQRVNALQGMLAWVKWLEEL
jgi:hypothetical protein